MHQYERLDQRALLDSTGLGYWSFTYEWMRAIVGRQQGGKQLSIAERIETGGEQAPLASRNA